MEIIKMIDISLLNFVHNYFQNDIFDKIMPIISFLGNGGIIWIIISLILITNKKYRKVGMLSFFALILSTILVEGILKNLMQRPRPFIEFTNINLLIKKPLSYSFPSGHATSSFAAAGVIGNMIRKYKVLTMILAGLIAFSRVYLFVHYPVDVIAGIILGLILSYLITYKFIKK
nr:phosphatase PAP2 family protein [Tepidibacter aestuarii]